MPGVSPAQVAYGFCIPGEAWNAGPGIRRRSENEGGFRERGAWAKISLDTPAEENNIVRVRNATGPPTIMLLAGGR